MTLGGLQVWHSLRERTGRTGVGAEVTIVFTDIVGFSEWAMRVGDEESLLLLRRVAAAPGEGGRRGDRGPRCDAALTGRPSAGGVR